MIEMDHFVRALHGAPPLVEGVFESRSARNGLRNRSLRRQLLAGHIPRWVANHPRRDYVMRAALAFPDWVDHNHIRPIYNRAELLTIIMGKHYVVDHIIPLFHPHVCGLTVPGNLRVVPYKVNAAKSNEWHPDQLEFPSDIFGGQYMLWPRLDLEV